MKVFAFLIYINFVHATSIMLSTASEPSVIVCSRVLPHGANKRTLICDTTRMHSSKIETVSIKGSPLFQASPITTKFDVASSSSNNHVIFRTENTADINEKAVHLINYNPFYEFEDIFANDLDGNTYPIIFNQNVFFQSVSTTTCQYSAPENILLSLPTELNISVPDGFEIVKDENFTHIFSKSSAGSSITIFATTDRPCESYTQVKAQGYDTFAMLKQASTSVFADPHLKFAHGGSADFKGKDKKLYNFLSAYNMNVNVKIEDSVFKLKDAVIEGKKIKNSIVNGSFLTEAHIYTITSQKTPIKASYYTSKVGSLMMAWMNGTINNTPFKLGSYMTKKIDECLLKAEYASIWCTCANWVVQIRPRLVFNRISGPLKRIDVSFAPKLEEKNFKGFPHGIIGQSFDGDNVDFIGRKDVYENIPVIKTEAMAEGAIEGISKDYEMKHEYDTQFKYTRFDNPTAPPRNLNNVKGLKITKSSSKSFTY